jgi:hypothetical protein
MLEKYRGVNEISFGSREEPDIDQGCFRTSRTRASTSSAGRADSSPAT